MSLRTLTILILLTLYTGCERSFVVVEVTDPKGLATSATMLRIGASGEQSDRGINALPETYAIEADPRTGFDHWVEAHGEAGLLARGHQFLIAPDNGGVVNVSITLDLACEVDADCDNGVFGDGVESCDQSVCVDGPQCPDPVVECADVVADETLGECRQVPRHEACEPVTSDGVVIPTYCDLAFGCIPGTSCSLEDENQPCPRVGACDPDLLCLSGRCVPQGPRDVSDGNPCTDDFCDNEAGPVHLPSPNGNVCDDEGSICVEAECVQSRCGDGYVDLTANELCDDGDANNDEIPDACRSDCVPARCGDGVTDLGEECDDGNDVDEDACLTSCTENICGDGVVNEGVEACDDGNASPLDACLPDCVLNQCGDSFLNPIAESCDDGANESFDGCSAECSFVAWENALTGPPVGGLIAFNVDGERLLGVATGNSYLAIEARTGVTRWTYAADATITAHAAGNSSLALSTTNGTVHGLSLTGPDVSGAPRWTRTVDTAPASIGVASGQGRDHIFAVDGNAKVYAFQSDSGNDQTLGILNGGGAGPYQGDVEARSVDPDAVCADCSLLVSNKIDGLNNGTDFGVAGLAFVAAENAYLFNFANSCAVGHLGLPSAIVGDLAFLRGAGINPGQRVSVAASATGQVYLLRLQDSNVCPVELTRTDLLSLGSAQTPFSFGPVISRASQGSDIWLVDDSGSVRRMREALGEIPFPYQLGGPPAAAPALGTGPRLFVGDEAGRLHAIDGETANGLWIIDLGSPLAGSPLVADDMVFVVLRDGRVLAVERGTEEAPRSWWSRERASADGSGRSTCDAGGGRETWAILSLFLLAQARFRRRNRNRTIG